MKKTTLIKSISGNDSIIFMLLNGRRQKLSDCDLEIRIYEDAVDIPTLGGTGKVKTYHAAVVICSDINQNVDLTALNTCYFEIQTDVETGYQRFERILLDKISMTEMNELDEWMFEILDMEKIRHLLSI